MVGCALSEPMSYIGLLTCHAVALHWVASNSATVQPRCNVHACIYEYMLLPHSFDVFVSLPSLVFPFPVGGGGEHRSISGFSSSSQVNE
jgi:hypothetical protein